MNQRDELFQEVFGGFLQDQDNQPLMAYKRYLNIGLESKKRA